MKNNSIKTEKNIVFYRNDYKAMLFALNVYYYASSLPFQRIKHK